MLWGKSTARVIILILIIFMVAPNMMSPAQAANEDNIITINKKTTTINMNDKWKDNKNNIFKITKDANAVTLNGNNYDYLRTCIQIEMRGNPLNLKIINARLQAPKSKPAIDIVAGGAGQVNMNIEGSVSLRSYRKMAGIHVPVNTKLVLNNQIGAESNLTVIGGSLGGEADIDDVGGAGIGGNFSEPCGIIEIYGGTINASGTCTDLQVLGGGAGIGGGYCGISIPGKGGVILVKGGTVTATGGKGGAGIGGGRVGSVNEIQIQSGYIVANGSNGGAAIGGGYKANGGNINIAGGKIYANGGENAAGIGGGNGETGGTINISNGVVTATGGVNGAGIGGGIAGTGGTINISNGTVTATGGLHGAGIGSGTFDRSVQAEGYGGTITINGGTIEAYGSCWGAGIGGAAGSNGGNITINGGNITAISKRVTNSDSFGAGIGGGNWSSGGNITITGGIITAISQNGKYKGKDLCGGAGIGGGDNGAGGTVIIKGTPIINASKGDASSNADNIGRGRTDLTNIASGTLKYELPNNEKKDISYVTFDVSHKPGQKYEPLEGATITANLQIYAPNAPKTNSQGLWGAFVERGKIFNYTVQKVGYKSEQGQLETKLENHGVSVKMAPTMGIMASPLKLKAGTPLIITHDTNNIKGTYYLVGKSAQPYDEESNLSSKAIKSTAENSENTGSQMDTSDIEEGNYQLYKVNNLGGVSAPIDILVDNTLPCIKKYERAADNSYIDLSFSEGVYGLNSDDPSAKQLVPLIRDNFKLTLENETSATVSIEAITKNDSDIIASASPLKGGEDVIRVFLNITDTLNGKEKIEIKPSDSNCIFDEVQNAMDESQTTGKIFLGGKQAPIVSNGNINVSKVTKTGATLTWEKASDEDTPDTALEYSVYQLTTNAGINTVEEVEKGSVIKGYTATMISFDVTDLNPDSSYYFNIIVKDDNNSKACYNTVMVATTQQQPAMISPASVSFDLSNPSDVSTSIDWGDCTSVTDVVNGNDHLLTAGACTIDKNNLMIGKDYLCGLNMKKTEKAEFNISFDSGSNAVLTVFFTDNHQDNSKKSHRKSHSKKVDNPNEITISVEKLSGMPGNSVETKLDLAQLMLPSNMLSREAAANAKLATITVNRVDTSKFSKELVAQIADRPVFQFELKLDGTAKEWNNPDAPITIAIPYKPTEAELKNLENITVWYLDGSGNAVSVPSGRYDAKTGTVTFTATHFSEYAVVYVEKSFNDIVKIDWAKKPIEVLASKGIMGGRTESEFAPNKAVTRVEYISALVRALGVNTQAEGNFSDISTESKYYEDIAVARMLEITKGVGNNCLNPEAAITRQDMLVLTERALRSQRKISKTGTVEELNQFSDKKDLAAYSINSIAALVQEGLIQGSNRRLNVHSYATRAEAAVFLYRIYNKY